MLLIHSSSEIGSLLPEDLLAKMLFLFYITHSSK